MIGGEKVSENRENEDVIYERPLNPKAAKSLLMYNNTYGVLLTKGCCSYVLNIKINENGTLNFWSKVVFSSGLRVSLNHTKCLFATST